MENDIVSLIVPIYNIETFVEECVSSLLLQDYPSLEIILIDDGSTDSSGLLCDKFGRCDNRVRVIHQKNSGLSAARNTGMKLATGKWIVFVDGDDVVASNYISCLVHAVIRYDADMAMCKGSVFYGEGGYSPQKGCTFKKLSREAAIDAILSESSASTSAWGKIARSEIWRSVTFPVNRKFEDLPVTWAIAMKCNQIVLCSADIYGYRKRLGSISEVPRLSSIKDYWVSIVQVASESKAIDLFPESLKMAFSFRLCLECTRLIEMIVRYGESQDNSESIMTDSILLLRKEVLNGVRNSRACLSQRFRILLFSMFPRFAARIKLSLFKM